jgi:hypothetical protein
VAAAGCAREAESGPKLTGRVLINGQPCRPASVLDFDVMFQTTDEGPIKKTYMAAVQEDGTFTFNGAVGKGVPVGKYKVLVIGPVLDAGGKPARKYINTFNAKSSPLEVEIKSESKEIMIDLEKKTAEVS